MADNESLLFMLSMQENKKKRKKEEKVTGNEEGVGPGRSSSERYPGGFFPPLILCTDEMKGLGTL